MKKAFIIIGLLASSFALAQVGINTETPTETLDINGSIRVRNIYTNPSISRDKIVVADENGVLKVKSTPPKNQQGIVIEGDPVNTGIDANLYAPVMITYIPINAAAGYYFTIADNKWVLNISNQANYYTGTPKARYEILWINR